jgi:uncharacterized membrane protein YraQ (UPF0718 family)
LAIFTKIIISQRNLHKPPETESSVQRIKWGTLFELLFMIGALCMFFIGGNNLVVTSFATVFSGIVLEALPFMLLGSVAGGLIEVYVSRDRLISKLPRKTWQTVLAAAALGFVCPVCECAVVPIAKRLLGKGLPVPAVIAFLLGAPLVNPIVGISTAVAYSFSVPVALLRLVLGYLIAVAAGLIMGRLYPDKISLIAVKAETHVHSHSCGCGHSDSYHLQSHHSRQGLMNAFRHASSDFMDVGQFLVIGAFIAALFQTVISRQSLAHFTSSPISAILVMMALAVALNICSEADAFVAASFRFVMPFSAQFAFMLLGPMLDIKLVLMYTGVFRRKAIGALSACVFIMVFLAVCCLHYLIPAGVK